MNGNMFIEVSSSSAAVNFPVDLPPPWFGITLGSYWLSGTACFVVALVLLYAGWLRRGPNDIGIALLALGLFLFSDAACQLSLGFIYWNLLHGNTEWSLIHWVRSVAVLVRVIFSVWAASSAIEAIPRLKLWPTEQSIWEHSQEVKQKLLRIEEDCGRCRAQMAIKYGVRFDDSSPPE
jgi:hypothetical protein